MGRFDRLRKLNARFSVQKGAAAGCMVCVTAQEMIPQAVEEDEPAGVVSIVLGFALMMALDVAL